MNEEDAKRLARFKAAGIVEPGRGKKPYIRETNSLLIQGDGITPVKLKGNDIWLTCPRCKREQPIQAHGFRQMTPGGAIRNQSHCTECRALPPYNAEQQVE